MNVQGSYFVFMVKLVTFGNQICKAIPSHLVLFYSNTKRLIIPEKTRFEFSTKSIENRPTVRNCSKVRPVHPTPSQMNHSIMNWAHLSRCSQHITVRQQQHFVWSLVGWLVSTAPSFASEMSHGVLRICSGVAITKQ